MDLDRDKIDQAYRAALNYHSHEVTMEVRQHAATLVHGNLEGLLGGLPIDQIIKKGTDLAGNFCDEWHQNKSMINKALSAMSWVPVLGPYIIKAQAAITVLDTLVVPVICGAEATATPDQGSTVPQGQGTR
jgi:hypothetical protein